MKHFLRALLILALLVQPLGAQVTIPNTLQAGATIRANELNTNFSELGVKALNRISGGTLEGNISLLADVTIDGVDISDFLITTGEVRAQAAGTVAVPSFSRTGDVGTGLYFPAASELALSLGGVQRFLLNASGLTVFGVNIIDATGKIPALSATYFTSLDGSALTNVTAATATNFSGALAGDITGTQGATAIGAGVIVNADINAAAAIVDTKLAQITTGGKVANSATTAVTAATAGTIALRDASGNLTIAGLTATTISGTTLTAATSVVTPALRLSTTPTAGHVLTSDASGNASWAASPTGTLGGSGTIGKIPVFVTNTTTLGDSVMTQTGTLLAIAGGLSVGTAPGAFGNGLVVSSNLPILDFYDANAGVDAKFWRFIVDGGLLLQKVNDAYNTATTLFTIDAAGNMNLPAKLVTSTFQVTTDAAAGRVLTSDASGNASWVAPSTDGVPSGAILLFDAACPAGYTRFVALDNRFPRGNSVYGATGGAESHVHTASGSSGNAGDHSHTFSGTTASSGSHNHATTMNTFAGGAVSAVISLADAGAHDHTYSGSTASVLAHSHTVSVSVDSSGNLPPYLNMIYCKKN